jgi:soluble lytic murein transglycosylase-like protein
MRRLAMTASATLAAMLAVVAGPDGASFVHGWFGGHTGRCPIPGKLRGAFVDASRATGVPLPLLAAVAHTESGFDPDARSEAGAVGVLQLMPRTAAALHFDPRETDENVMAGAAYLRQLLTRFSGVERALAAYNAGPTAVDRLGSMPNAETKAYVRQVLETRRAYGTCS